MKWEDLKWKQSDNVDTVIAYVPEADAAIGRLPNGNYYIAGGGAGTWNDLDVVAAQCVLMKLAEDRK